MNLGFTEPSKIIKQLSLITGKGADLHCALHGESLTTRGSVKSTAHKDNLTPRNELIWSSPAASDLCRHANRQINEIEECFGTGRCRIHSKGL